MDKVLTAEQKVKFEEMKKNRKDNPGRKLGHQKGKRKGQNKATDAVPAEVTN